MEDKAELQEILSRFKGDRDELIPVLEAVQEKYSYLPADAMQEVSRFLHVPPSTVYGVSTFYALFRLVPSGKNVVRVCRGTACHVRGGARILNEVSRRLGIKPGQTSTDMKYSLDVISCFGSCALAPVMVVNNNVYGRMTPSKVGEILGEYD